MLMATETFTVRDALTRAIAGLTLLQTDARLGAAEQALVGELLQVDTLALNALRPDGTIAAGQRNARAQAIEDKVFALGNVVDAHQDTITIAEFYNMLDLSEDAAGAIRLAAPSFRSDISTVQGQ